MGEKIYKITDDRFKNDLFKINRNHITMRYVFGYGWVCDPSLDEYTSPDSSHWGEYDEITQEEAAAVIEKEERYLQDLLKKAEETAKKAHAEQKDKSGFPYIGHVRRVAANVKGTREKTVAWLHDVVEDTAVTMEDLKKIFPTQILYHVNLLTRKEGVSYPEYLEAISKDPVARRVKLSDLRDNSDITRIIEPDIVDVARVDKYHRAQAFLLAPRKDLLKEIKEIEDKYQLAR